MVDAEGTSSNTVGRTVFGDHATVGVADRQNRSLAEFCDLGFRANQNIPLKVRKKAKRRSVENVDSDWVQSLCGL